MGADLPGGEAEQCLGALAKRLDDSADPVRIAACAALAAVLASAAAPAVSDAACTRLARAALLHMDDPNPGTCQLQGSMPARLPGLLTLAMVLPLQGCKRPRVAWQNAWRPSGRRPSGRSSRLLDSTSRLPSCKGFTPDYSRDRERNYYALLLI